MKGYYLSLFLVALGVNSSEALISGQKASSISLQHKAISSSSSDTKGLDEKTGANPYSIKTQ